MFLYNREGLVPLASPYDTTDELLLRRGLSDQHLDQMQSDVLRLVNASRRSSVSESLRYMRRSLNELCNVASLLVPLNESEATFAAITADLPDDSDDDDEDVDRVGSRSSRGGSKGSSGGSGTLLSQQRPPMAFLDIPRLVGRATVVLSFRRPGSERIVPSTSSGDDGAALVTLVVDGTNYPINGGSFVDLCLRGYYNQLPVRCEPFEFEGERVLRTVFGSDKAAFTDPLTAQPRRLPLEVLRDTRTAAVSAAAAAAAATTSAATNSNGNSNSTTASTSTGASIGNGVPAAASSDGASDSIASRFTATGLARNSAVFTKAQPVLSFATYGSIGMVHSIGDGLGGGGASSSFFWVPPDRSLSVSEREASPAVKRLTSRCSLFAHVIEGNDVLEMLKPGDILATAEVKEEGSGVWKLLRPADFRDVLLPAEEEEE
jgi:hypothetical protein